MAKINSKQERQKLVSAKHKKSAIRKINFRKNLVVLVPHGISSRTCGTSLSQSKRAF